MDGDKLQHLRTWFADYVSTFKSSDSNLDQGIILKEEHTLRVCGEILYIAANLELSDDFIQLAEIAALFHDIGRFDQYRRFRTFADGISVNHAELGVEILQENEALHQLGESDQSLVLRAISYHNRLQTPDDETANCLLLSKLLRDADKLDIWNVMLSSYERDAAERDTMLEIDLPDTPGFSEGMQADLRAGLMPRIQNVSNRNDHKLLQIGWIYDVNFQPSFRRIIEREYLQRYHRVLPASNEVEEMVGRVGLYLNSQLGSENH